MKWVFLEIKENHNFISPSPSLLLLPPPPIRSNTSFDLNSKISPSILLIIIILSIIFFISGLLHLLVRFLLSPSSRDRDDYFDNVTALQGQLQQLFHLHDSGVDQSFIDTLPVFHYKSIIGLKNYPFDCAVCLCEFESEDKLRLLPKCSHAFHMDCIDTWLLSHSTCPLCRSSLLSDFSSLHNPCSPYLLVLESGSDHSSREIVTDRGNEDIMGRNSDIPVADPHSNSNSHLGLDGIHDISSTHLDPSRKVTDSGEKVVPFAVKLGKFRNIDDQEGESSSKNMSNNSNVDERRCFSMGSYEYIMDEESVLKVHVSTKKVSSKNHRLSGHRTAMSECGNDSIGMFKFNGSESMRIEKQKGEREDCSLRSSSFRFQIQRNPNDGSDEENQKRENSESLEIKTPSFAKRTMLWLAGRQNKLVHPSSSSHV